MSIADGLATIALLTTLMSSTIFAAPPNDSNRARFLETYAKQKYSKVNCNLHGQLTPIFEALGQYGVLAGCFHRDLDPEKYDAYRKLLVESLSDALRGDEIEGIFAQALVQLAPPKFVLDSIAPELGRGGRLSGILDGNQSYVAFHIQRQPQSGFHGTPNFMEYERFLTPKRGGRITAEPNANLVIVHMFRTDPDEAFMSLLVADYGFGRYATSSPYRSYGEEGQEVRALQLIQADMRDYRFRTRYSFPLRPNQAKSATDQLVQLSQHRKWWVRFYAACLMADFAGLRSADIIDQLRQDQDEHVAARIRQLQKKLADSSSAPPPAEPSKSAE